MSGFRRELFHVKHLDVMDIRPIDRDVVRRFNGVRFLLDNSPLSMTVIYEGRIIACMGFIEVLPGVAEGWIIPSIYVKNIPKLFAREVRWYIEAQAKTFKWHRVQTLSRPDEHDQRWMRFLGFEKEGVMKQYLGKEDFVMSARYFNWGV